MMLTVVLAALQIVVPDAYRDKAEEASVSAAAALFVRTLDEQKVEARVVREAEAKPAAEGRVYLGATKFAADSGVRARPHSVEYALKSVGGDLVVLGCDGEKGFRGTLFAACQFLHDYAGLRVLCPGKYGFSVVPGKDFRLPDDLDVRREPWYREHDFMRGDDLFFEANHGRQFRRIWSRWGHQHPSAVPKEKYAKGHPEYFVEVGGVRDPSSGHLCFSNPEVRELIYRHILDRCDEGYEVVELGQGDGFTPCGCGKCRELYGIRPTASPDNAYEWIMDRAWSEKIWIMHRDMALRLLKDRPGAKVMISAYHVTLRPPLAIDEFPPNVIIEMMTSTRENFDAWAKKKVPGGYAAYLYSWGLFHEPGLTPLNEVSYFQDEARLFKERNVRIVQVNGLPFQWGLEGPNAYAYLRLGIDPDAQTARELYDEYLEAAFREAQDPMRRFFDRVQRNAAMWRTVRPWIQRNCRDGLRALGAVWTPEIIRQLGADLALAEKAAVREDVKARLATVRGEYDFLAALVNVVYAWHEYQRRDDDASFGGVLDALEARARQVDEMVARRGTPYNPALSLNRETLMNSGTHFLNRPPFNWDVKKFRKEGRAALQLKTTDCFRMKGPVTIDSADWGAMRGGELQVPSDVQAAGLRSKASFRVAYDDRNLYVRMETDADPMRPCVRRARDAEIWLQDAAVLTVCTDDNRTRYRYFTWEPVEGSFADAGHGDVTDTYDPRFGWNDWTWDGDWMYETKVAGGRWISMATIPFATLGVEPPKENRRWNFNFGRVHFDAKGTRELSVWTGRLMPSHCPGDGSFGTIVFGGVRRANPHMVKGVAARDAGFAALKAGDAATAERQFRAALQITKAGYAWRCESLLALTDLLLGQDRAAELKPLYDEVDLKALAPYWRDRLSAAKDKVDAKP